MLNLVAHDESFRWVIILAGILYIIAPFSIIRHLAQRHVVDQETMMGAVSAYLLFGIAFAFLYLELGTIQTNFWGNGQEHVTMRQTFFFSFTTLTTTGYGNLVPAGNPGQTIAVVEMILGQLFLITALGKIVTEWRPRGWNPDDPAGPPLGAGSGSVTSTTSALVARTRSGDTQVQVHAVGAAADRDDAGRVDRGVDEHRPRRASAPNGVIAPRS